MSRRLPWRVRRLVARAGLPAGEQRVLLAQLARGQASGADRALLVVAAQLGVLSARGALDPRVVRRMIEAGS